jgi:anti-sigma-K factor RskA
MAAEPKFAAEVAFWETRLGGLAELVPAVVPPAKVWAGIEDRFHEWVAARNHIADDLGVSARSSPSD